DSWPDLRDWSPHRMNRRGLIRIVGPTDCTTAELAKQAGLPVLDIRGWAKGPRQETATAVVARFERLLGAAPGCGTFAGLRLLDRPSTYNKNLDPSKARPGVWVGATPSSWATRAWCVVRLDDRLCPDRVVELPRDPSLPAFGEAWRITCALGAAEGTPATFSHDGSFLRLSFPAPPWVARQLDLLGSRSTAAPFRWLLPAKDLPVARSLLRNELWMVELPPPRSPDQR
ncbi:MAG TPA: hypothetical protein PLA94_28235, partial [Myxococcota bacterium]|nr:hypothetical protein [Myxococcota bacterium]